MENLVKALKRFDSLETVIAELEHTTGKPKEKPPLKIWRNI